MNISKKELLEDYYPDEIPQIMKEYAELNKVGDNEEKEVSAEDF